MRAPLLSRSHRRRSRREFSPQDIGGLQLQLDFSDPLTLFTDSAKTTLVSSDGDVIGAVADKSGDGNDATQATTAEKPLYKTGIQNGLSVGRFDGTDDWLDLAGMTVSAGSFTFFYVVNPANIGGTNKYFFDTETGRFILGHFTSGAGKTGWNDDAWQDIADAIVGTQILTFHFNSGGNGEMYRDGVSLGSDTYTAKAVGDGVGIMSKFDGAVTFCLEADLMEVLVYDSALSIAHRQNVEAYLNNKWAVY